MKGFVMCNRECTKPTKPRPCIYDPKSYCGASIQMKPKVTKKKDHIQVEIDLPTRNLLGFKCKPERVTLKVPKIYKDEA